MQSIHWRPSSELKSTTLWLDKVPDRGMAPPKLQAAKDLLESPASLGVVSREPQVILKARVSELIQPQN